MPFSAGQAPGYLQQGGGRVAPRVPSHLINLCGSGNTWGGWLRLSHMHAAWVPFGAMM